MTLKQAALTSVREFQHRMKGYTEVQNSEWEKARWIAFSIFSPFIKNGPKTPEQWVRFSWESAPKKKIVRIDSVQENRLNDLYMDFMSTKNKIKS